MATTRSPRPLRVAALVKQIPAFEELQLGPDGRLQRAGLDLEMNPYCRRAVSQAVAIAADTHGTCTVLTLGPPRADDTLREAIAWGTAREVDTTGVLVTDPAFAGSDTLATARALAAAIRHVGPFDLVLVGRNSVDADTGQVGPELAELLDLPFATGVRHLALDGDRVDVRCEYDDGWVQAWLSLPAVLSTAERLIEPCKVDPDDRALVDHSHIRRLSAAELGPGPWGEDGSPTRVGTVRVHEVARDRCRLDGPVDAQVRAAVAALISRGALDTTGDDDADHATVPAARQQVDGPMIGVTVEPDRPVVTRELLGAAAVLAAQIAGTVVAITVADEDPAVLGSWGADRITHLTGIEVEEDVARGLADWATEHAPWALLLPSTAGGREVAARAAARLGAGLTGDAVDLEVTNGRLTAWKPAFGGQMIAAITATSPVQMATVRAGMLPQATPRHHTATVTDSPIVARQRVHVLARTRDDDLDALAEADAVIGIGMGVGPNEYEALTPLLRVLGAELAATRKVTDKGWLPRARQVGITGRSIAPRLYVSIGASGKFNHVVGIRGARTVLAINPRADALIFDSADIGIVADWHEAVPLLVAEVERVAAATPAG